MMKQNPSFDFREFLQTFCQIVDVAKSRKSALQLTTQTLVSDNNFAQHNFAQMQKTKYFCEH